MFVAWSLQNMLMEHKAAKHRSAATGKTRSIHTLTNIQSHTSNTGAETMCLISSIRELKIFMAARQLAGRRPLYFTADVSILLLTLFFRRLISEVTKLCHMFGGDCNL